MGHREKIESFLESVAKAPLSVLLLDYDGTLAPFSLDRDRAVPYAGVTEVLQTIVAAGRTRLVIITGRDAREIGPLLGVKPLPEVWGAHGLQRLRPDGTCEMPEIPPGVAQALDDAKRWLSYQGLQSLAETKPGSIAVHWRGLDETAASELRSRILLGWFRVAERGALQLLEFDGGVEIRMPHLDKGNAVRTVSREVGPDVPIAYLGDDAADEHAFQALGIRGLTILVGAAPRRTSAEVWLRAPGDLLEFLSSWEKATAAQLGAVQTNSR
ncbi:MAG TPA: trehalose-phosphatase [Terriglobales bacterium]|nr:trehalose-phosphatase [Terriglobales bacterium]